MKMSNLYLNYSFISYLNFGLLEKLMGWSTEKDSDFTGKQTYYVH